MSTYLIPQYGDDKYLSRQLRSVSTAVGEPTIVRHGRFTMPKFVFNELRSDLDSKLTSKTAELLDHSKRAIKAIDEKSAQILSIAKQKDILLGEMQQTIEKLENATEALGEKSALALSLNRHKDILLGEKQQITEKLEEVTKALGEKSAQVLSLTRQNDTLLEEKHEAAGRIKKLADEVEKNQRIIAVQKNKIDDLEKENQLLLGEASLSKLSLEESDTKLQIALQTIAELQSRLNQPAEHNKNEQVDDNQTNFFLDVWKKLEVMFKKS